MEQAFTLVREIFSMHPLRLMLNGCALLIAATAPLADGTVHAHDWRLLPGVVAPAVMMMLAFALPLDMTMARIFAAEATPERCRHLRFVVRLEGCVLGCMFLAWLPFLLNVLELSPFG